jgi:predicted AAA+ superfamily ATPase
MIEIFTVLKKYNFWDNNKKIPLGFLRKGPLEKLKPFLGNRLVKVIMGQRRVGKSYLLRQVIDLLRTSGTPAKNIFYLNKELVDFDAITTYRDLQALIAFTKKKLKIKGKMVILLDEVQEIAGWEKIVNSLSQNYKTSDELIITGSNSTMLSSELATLLSGRYVSFELFPFSYAEFREVQNLPQSKESFLSYLKTGGLPELFHLPEEEQQRHYVVSLKDTILLKDIVQRFGIKNAPLLERLFLFLSDNIGNLFSLYSILRTLQTAHEKVSHETLGHYMQYLCQCFLIHEVPRYDVKGKSIFGSSKKYYLNDLSFRRYLHSSFDPGLGKHLENAIFLHYRSEGYKVMVGSIGKQEVDFIVEKGTTKKYIQVAYSLQDSKVLKRELTPLQSIRDAYEKILISLDDTSFGNIEGISHRLAWEL